MSGRLGLLQGSPWQIFDRTADSADSKLIPHSSKHEVSIDTLESSIAMSIVLIIQLRKTNTIHV